MAVPFHCGTALIKQNLDLTICAKRYMSVPSSIQRQLRPRRVDGCTQQVARGVQPSTQRGRSCLCAS